MPNSETVQLGDRLFPVVPQKHAKIRRYITAEDFTKIMSGDYGKESYRILCVLIPALKPENGGMQEWEFDGFATKESQEAFYAGDLEAYDEESDPGVTTDQIIGAVETALMVSGGRRLGKLMTLVTAVANVNPQGSPTDISPALPGSNGASTSTPSGTSPTTSIESGD